MDPNTVVKVDFAELADGSLVEMIEDPADTTETLFAVYSNGHVRYTDRIEDAGRILVPLSRADEALTHLHLAQGAEAYGRVEELEADLVGLLGECLDLKDDHRILIGAFVMSTMLIERLSVAPYLALVGPPGSGKTTAMRLLSWVCYRGLMTADISSSAFYDISHRLRPTILIDEALTAGRPRELIHLLKASSTVDCVSLRRGKARLAYGPKVFSWLELPNDAALNSRCIIVPMRKTSRTDLKILTSPRILEIARRIRMRLLQFRFERFRNISMPEAPANLQLSGRPLDLYRALALPFDSEEDIAKLVGSIIVDQDRLQARVLSPAQTATLRVLDGWIHKYPDGNGFNMRALNVLVNSDLASVGETCRLNERKLGDILTSLSFTNRTRKNTGYVLWLDRSDRAKIHEACRNYSIEGTRGEPIESCEVCTQPNAPAAIAPPARVQTEKRLRGEDSEREGREHRERRSPRPRVRRRVSSR